jgi:hypothetical protein
MIKNWLIITVVILWVCMLAFMAGCVVVDIYDPDDGKKLFHYASAFNAVKATDLELYIPKVAYVKAGAWQKDTDPNGMKTLLDGLFPIVGGLR